MHNTYSIRIDNVTKKIRNKTIINGLSLNVKKGEVFGLLGPNGAGKTTTIRMIVGLMSITSGDIFIADNSVTKNKVEALGKIGAIVENPDLYTFMSGYNNLKYFSKLHKGITKKKIDDVVEVVGLSKSIHNKVKTYSLGMKQRLGLAQSLLHDPQVLILDEPTNGLDPAGIREFREYIRKLALEQNITIIVSSHLLSEIELMCDRVAIIQEGKLIRVENLREENKKIDELKMQEVIIELKQLSNVSMLLKEQYPHLEFRIFKNSVTLSTTNEEISSIVKLLVKNDLDIYRIRELNKTLEDRFLEITEKGGKEYVNVGSK